MKVAEGGDDVTLDQIADGLPWGFHDAHLESMAIDWQSARLSMVMRLPMTEHQEMDQRARVVVTGLAYCAIDPPEDLAREDETSSAFDLWIDFGTGAFDEEAKSRLPATPDGCFLNYLFVQDWNRTIHICGQNAELTWLVPARSSTRALFPGEEVPDPEPAK